MRGHCTYRMVCSLVHRELSLQAKMKSSHVVASFNSTPLTYFSPLLPSPTRTSFPPSFTPSPPHSWQGVGVGQTRSSPPSASQSPKARAAAAAAVTSDDTFCCWLPLPDPPHLMATPLHAARRNAVSYSATFAADLCEGLSIALGAASPHSFALASSAHSSPTLQPCPTQSLHPSMPVAPV